MIKKIIEFIISVFTYKEETPNKSEISAPGKENSQAPTINQVEPKQPENSPKTAQKEVYKMLTNKERQTYLKKLGLYTKKIDNIRGSGQKKAEKQFNTIFLNKKEDTYTEETDKLLRIIYKSYSESPYMQTSDWKYFKNFKKSEYKCKCKGKYCNGYPSEIAMRLVMEDQYLRNYFGAAVRLTSGVRCKTHNKNVGGVSKSKHMEGLASDKNITNQTAANILKVIKTLPFNRYCYDITKKEVHGDVKK